MARERLAIEVASSGQASSRDHPAPWPNLVGPGWAPINPTANFNPAVFSMQGKQIQLPNFGMETVHHVHADDVAQCFVKAMEHRSAALGEAFHVVSPAATTLQGYAERVSAWFGHPAQLQFLSGKNGGRELLREMLP